MVDLCAFGSDNFSPAHPNVLNALLEANQGYAMAYGKDPWTEKALALFQKIFGPEAEAFLVYTGTAANVCIIKHLLASWQGILCPKNAHIWTDECGAAMALSGCAILTLPAKEGKFSVHTAENYLSDRGNCHRVQPRAIFLTQATELGTIYTLEELREISNFAKKERLLLFMDGARLCNAAATLGLSLRELTTDVGVDALSFGGTKNGMMGAEAVIFLKKGLADNFPYVRKQQLHLASKMRFLSAQFLALFKEDLWLQNACHANKMAKYFKQKLQENCKEFSLAYPVEANSLFVKVPSHLLTPLEKKGLAFTWDKEESLVRFVTSWDTKIEWIDTFMAKLRNFISSTP